MHSSKYSINNQSTYKQHVTTRTRESGLFPLEITSRTAYGLAKHLLVYICKRYVPKVVQLHNMKYYCFITARCNNTGKGFRAQILTSAYCNLGRKKVKKGQRYFTKLLKAQYYRQQFKMREQ